MSLVRNTATIGGLTLVSRIAGFLRDMLMAQYVGAGLANDAFLIAWRLPNLFRALFAEGAFSSAFVPMFNREVGRKGGGLQSALGFADEVLAILFPVVILLVVAMMLLAGPVVWAMTGGFPDGGPEKFALAVQLTRITFPYLALISLVSLMGGILNSVDRFWVNAAAPILLNLCMIAGLLFFRGHTPLETAHTQAIAVTVSGVFQLGWLIWACDRAGTGLMVRRPRFNPRVRELLRIIWPAALGAGAVQFNLLISTSLAARFLPQGAVSYLYYADRLNQLPFALIGIGVGTAMLPGLSRQIGAGDEKGAGVTMNRAMELVLVLTLPATAALMIAAGPIIRALLQHGAFTAHDATASAWALAAFSIGLPANIMIKVLVPGFYARADTKTPVRIALIAMLANLIMNLILIWPMQHVGLALSTALSCWVNAGLLWWNLRKRDHFRIDARLKTTAIKLLLATLAMAALLLIANPIVAPHMVRGLFERAVWLIALMILGAAVYFGAAIALGAFRPAEFKARFTRRRAP
ncbi:putative peptidoglycan lipid II flippase [Sphingomonas vulcanisoli]|uniref:Probable lipid II flippase MurJ n=1 Tax=Sphingomonas vulcanisoli TaxID=1658060 RepID=A0ABX0TVL9_9SPHN|nr:putative peptidoglycan lipid II flippase [Sphingomonas vulcanisoli]